MDDAPSAFCKAVVENPEMSNATARFGAWLIGAAAMTGGFPLELSIHQIRYGFERNGVAVHGFGGRYETINASIDWLQGNGYLAVTEGRALKFGYTARVFSLTL